MESANQELNQGTAQAHTMNQNSATGQNQDHQGQRNQDQARQRKARVFTSKVFLVTLGTQSYLVRGAKTEAGAKRAAQENLPVTARLLESGELLDLLKAGEFPPEITVSVDDCDIESVQDQTGQQGQGKDQADQPAQSPVSQAPVPPVPVPVEAFTDDQSFLGGRTGFEGHEDHDGHSDSHGDHDSHGREFL